MAETNIEWTDETWNPLRGCSRISPGYTDKGAAGTATGTWNGKIKFVHEKLSEPLRWRKSRRVFVNSMSDLFHENVPDEWIDRIFAVMWDSPRHTFQILTKRAGKMREYMSDERMVRRRVAGWLRGNHIQNAYSRATELSTWPPRNVWLGVSVENQETAETRIPELLRTPAAVRFVSYEPALGPIQFTSVCGLSFDRLHGHKLAPGGARIDWLICGGESGPDARPMHPDWARAARNQCQAAGVKFFFKQWGEFSGIGPTYKRVGKKRAGRLLDGREWNEMPERAERC